MKINSNRTEEINPDRLINMFVIGTVHFQRSKGKKFKYDYNYIDNSDNHL